ncbi:hypothetical protein QFC20_002314 [Naganishia adeliensis]|uniref:Uncharacterized protein n=1 Tax=Naganishia adeliensis TaxID=92952 RepID=A0ACC2WK67_9TREE|nr:hypothetical protein QFC20_002314 [Naganishia adeliensis]
MSVGAETKTPSTTDVTVYDKRTYLEKRALVAGQLCATIPVTVPGSFLTGPISIATLNANIPLSINLALAITVYLLNTGVINAAITAAQTRLNAIAPTCNYPTNSIPACSTYAGAVLLTGTSCYFTCSATTKDCGQFCIPLTQNCVSGIPAQRALAPESDLCPSGLTACYLGNLASLATGRKVSWDCLDTEKDIESCGGCQFPQIAEAQGEDCTEMDGVDEVTCNEGKCEAISCIRGFKLNGTECVHDATYKSFWVQHA